MSETRTKPDLGEIRTTDYHSTSEPATGDGDSVIKPTDYHSTGEPDSAAPGTALADGTAVEPGDGEEAPAAEVQERGTKVTKPKPGNAPYVTKDYHSTSEPAKNGTSVPKPRSADDRPTGDDAA